MGPGDIVGGRFEIERQAGSGGMGVVFRARDLETGAVVALKILRDNFAHQRGRFLREGEILAELHHPCIVRHVAHGVAGGRPFLALEWLDGEDLGRRLARGPLGVSEVVELGRLVALALGAIHARGVTHRDVKPSNIFLLDGRSDRIKVLDFGIARLDQRLSVRATATGDRLGTPRYMAPEQAQSSREADARADVFALGCVFFECLTGRPAFPGNDGIAVVAKILLEEVPDVRTLRPETPAGLARLVGEMLGKDPRDRPADGAAVATALDVAGGPEQGVEPPPAREERVLGPTERRLLSVVVVGAPAPARTAEGSSSSDADAESRRAVLAPLVRTYGGRLAELDGCSVVVLTGGGVATDRTANAARCALAIREQFPGVPVVVATGHGEPSERLPVGEVIDRAVELWRSCAAESAGPIVLDTLTAGLLEGRFELQPGAPAHLLTEKVEPETRSLLGKPTPLVGRDRELETLLLTYRQCVSDAVAHAVLLTGGAGVGKSRLLHELLKRIRDEAPAPRIRVGRGDPMRAGSPYGMLAAVVRRAAGIAGTEPIERRRRKLEALVARRGAPDAARIAAFLGEISGVPFGSGGSHRSHREAAVQLAAARRDPVVMGDQIARAFDEWLRVETADQPVVVVLEDLHWGDLPSVRLVDGALRELRDRPLFVVALGRPEVEDLFPRLWADRAVLGIRLSELSPRACESLVRQVLGEAAGAALGPRIAELCAGNAFYLEELIRAVAEGRDRELPETLVAMVQARLERLEPDARRILRAASIFGESFWEAGLRSLLGPDGEALLAAWLSLLVEREVVSRRSESRLPGQREYVFRHAVLREAAYASLVTADRTLGHRLAGQWLDSAGEHDATALALHFEQGQEPLRAVSWFRRAGAQALEGGDLDAVLACVSRAATCGAAGETLGALRQLEGEARLRRGEFAEADLCASEALALLPRGSDAWFLALGNAVHTAGRRGLRERVFALAEELRCALGDPAEATAAKISALCLTTTPLRRSGRTEQAAELSSWAEAASAAIGEADPAAAGLIARDRANQALFRADLGRYVECHLEARPLFDRAGYRRLACSSAVSIGYGHLGLGDWEHAEQALCDAFDAATREGLLDVAHAAQHNLGLAVGRQGRLAEAIALERPVADVFRDAGDPRLEGAARTYLAILLELAGDLVAAGEEARRAAAVLGESSPVWPFARAIEARVELSSGRPTEALVAARAAHAFLSGPGRVEEGETEIRLVYAEALAATGDRTGAKAAIGEARRRLLERAAGIGSAELRERFLARVPDNRRTLELANLWASG